MLNIGGGELLVIFLVALVVLGPTKLPDAARQVGKIVGEFRRISSGFQRELKDALDDPVERATRDARNDVTSLPPAKPAEGAGAAEDTGADASDPKPEAPSESDEPPMYGDR